MWDSSGACKHEHTHTPETSLGESYITFASLFFLIWAGLVGILITKKLYFDKC